MKKIIILLLFVHQSFSQAVPSKDENVDYIATFSKAASGSWGDDDHVQIYFYAIPKTHTQPFYIRIFDPNIGGKHDQINKDYNSKSKFSIYGGKSAYSNKDARGINPVGNYKSGNQLASKIFAAETEYDDMWYTFGPFNPTDGEWDEGQNGYVFKIITEGLDGDDGNMYRMFFSESEKENKAIQGGNSFAYEICFRLNSSLKETAHFYPFVDKNVTSVTPHNFDFDVDGNIRLNSVTKKLFKLKCSKDNAWSSDIFKIVKEEQNTSLDIQVDKSNAKPNDLCFYITNQYNEAIPFYSVPLGGAPKFKYKINITVEEDK